MHPAREAPSPAAQLDRRLGSPTIGAYRRAHGHTGMCDQARILLATELAHEAIRRAVIDRLEGILAGVPHDPRHIAARLRHLADQIDPPATTSSRTAA